MNKSNLANGLLQGSLDTTSTTVNLQSGYGNIMPAVPFYITVTPFGQLSTMGNSEIMQVTARTGDTLTVVRGQRGTTAKSFINGDVISNGIYTEDIDEKATKLSIPSGTVPYRQGVGNGEPDSSMLISDDATAGTLAQYGSGGTMVVGSPTDDAHAATKKYVDDSLTFNGYQADSSVQFTQNGATITTINLPAGRIRFGVFSCNVQLTSGNSNYYYPRVSLDGVGAQASFQMSPATGQVSVTIPFSTTDASKTSIRVRGWNTTEARTFERMSWWCVGIN